MNLLPIRQTLAENSQFLNEPDLEVGLPMTIEFFDRIGYTPPWIGYVVNLNDTLVGSAAFKGKPKDGRIEIAYGVFPRHQQKGIGTKICGQLVRLALQTDPSVIVTARTLPEPNYSTRILEKNDFVLLGTVWDEEDGDVWEWEYRGRVANGSRK
ncbi:GNAT family N-acetyltransferase [Spirosoma sp. BT702]|uniref:GNAT family N-acetyltransferase n=1 Tax=Spirosoma profusum TaxID=2771354 RepID=A0A926Y3F5_9BACT|nr:GNAT family N-acetyltransferase [Spirosoma profusum]MBD2701840.1 GNAT family N-acetyltransferase [Spirosoma profusum]